jgi:PadR family transcriptional regulator
MENEKAELLQGTLDMLVLKALKVEKMHGFGVARWIERTTGDRLVIEEGALYPALYRMQRRGWIASEWGVSENNRKAKFYHLTHEGHTELEKQARSWHDSVAAVRSVLTAVNP